MGLKEGVRRGREGHIGDQEGKGGGGEMRGEERSMIGLLLLDPRA